eukprot:TRINITY_DN3546_c0_g1_i1.p1 TRINITY_DN3546_c0_g1~~TRINITY_DN3546_c0_g1_i1.p1  ORF type:complete len:276 (-),score=55.40 TRINITY_DN3546_c0_g1_i1:20-847(-)
MISELEKNGHVKDQSVFDKKWVDNSRSIIEKAYSINGSPVVLVSHSMGGLIARKFLNLMTREWRDKFISQWIPIATPWGGAFREVQALLSGYCFGFPYDETRWKNFGRSLLSLIFSFFFILITMLYYPGGFTLLPNPKVYGNLVLVNYPGKNYTSYDYYDMLVSTGFSKEESLFYLRQSEVLNDNFVFPSGVNTTCVISKNVKTAHVMNYNSKWELQNYSTTSGDGTVPEDSARWMCQEWKSQGNHIEIQVLDGVNHGGIIKDKNVINLVKSASN